jgi:hypothetical protein
VGPTAERWKTDGYNKEILLDMLTNAKKCEIDHSWEEREREEITIVKETKQSPKI